MDMINIQPTTTTATASAEASGLINIQPTTTTASAEASGLTDRMARALNDVNEEVALDLDTLLPPINEALSRAGAAELVATGRVAVLVDVRRQWTGQLPVDWLEGSTRERVIEETTHGPLQGAMDAVEPMNWNGTGPLMVACSVPMKAVLRMHISVPNDSLDMDDVRDRVDEALMHTGWLRAKSASSVRVVERYSQVAPKQG